MIFILTLDYDIHFLVYNESYLPKVWCIQGFRVQILHDKFLIQSVGPLFLKKPALLFMAKLNILIHHTINFYGTQPVVLT